MDAARAAKQAGLHTNYVSHGAITENALLAIASYLDVFRADIKGFSDATYRRLGHLARAQEIREVAQAATALGMHVEVVTNIVPGFNDSDSELASAGWIGGALGPDTPWHVTRFIPHLRLAHLLPTPIQKLERAHTIGLQAGLHYVYVGNVPGHPWANTYCHSCGNLVIERRIFAIVRNELRRGACPACGQRVPGTFQGTPAHMP